MEYLPIIIGGLGTLSSVLFAFIGYQKGLKTDCSTAGKTDGALLSDVGYIKSGIDDLKRKQETSDMRHYALAERVIKVEESTKQAHKRIDGIEKE